MRQRSWIVLFIALLAVELCSTLVWAVALVCELTTGPLYDEQFNTSIYQDAATTVVSWGYLNPVGGGTTGGGTPPCKGKGKGKDKCAAGGGKAKGKKIERSVRKGKDKGPAKGKGVTTTGGGTTGSTPPPASLNGIRLGKKGGVYSREKNSISAKIYALADGDFDGDYDQDAVGIVIEHAGPSAGKCYLRYLRNRGINLDGTHKGFDYVTTELFASAGISNTCQPGGVVLLAGDVNGDTWSDLLYLEVNDPVRGGLLRMARLFIYSSTIADVPYFAMYDVSASLAGLSWHMGSSVGELIDWDDDGLDDLVIATSGGTNSLNNKVLLYTAAEDGHSFHISQTLIDDIGLRTPIATTTRAVRDDPSCTPATSYGATVLIVQDTDNDYDFDIVVGSASQNVLKYWQQGDDFVFRQLADIPFSPGGPRYGFGDDVDGDGDYDMVLARYGRSCGAKGGSVWMYLNDGRGNFTMSSAALGSIGDDLVWADLFDANPDEDELSDIMAGRLEKAGQYTLFRAKPSNLYNLTGVAISREVDNIDEANAGIVSVRVPTLVSNASPPATTLTYYVSNDGGLHWEQLTTNELPPTSAEHVFVNFGGDLRWKAVFTAAAATDLTASERPYSPAARTSPTIDRIVLEYKSVGQRNYSRSALTLGNVTIAGVTKEYIYSAAFQYPGYQGHLYAYDMTAMAAGSGVPSNYERVDSSSILRFDAGAQLAGTAGSARTLYTAHAAGGDGIVNDRILLADLAVQYPSEMGAGSVSIANTVVNFISSGMGGTYKFYDPGHSSPVYVGAPKGDDNYLGSNYSSYKLARKNRLPAVYIGANDGMLHSFNAATGNENWGFVPNNLLTKLSAQRSVDDGYLVKYRHTTFVDGPVVKADIQIGSEWRTLLFSGQAQGQGRANNNYLFALDVTEPANPQPLWEFTDDWAGYSGTCTGTGPLTDYSCTPDDCGTTCVSSCDSEGTAQPYYTVSGGQIVIEAETYSTYTKFGTSDNWTLAADGTNAANGYLMQSDQTSDCTSSPLFSCGAELAYDLFTESAATYNVWVRIAVVGSSSRSLQWGIDSVSKGSFNTSSTAYEWKNLGSHTFTAGIHTLAFWSLVDDFKLDKIIISPASSITDSSAKIMSATCGLSCVPNDCSTFTCSTITVNECATGLNCCSGSGGFYCAADCSTPADTVLGETWSAPLPARLRVSGQAKWVLFFGSGYNNRSGVTTVGRSLYMIDAATGTKLAQWDTNDLAYASPANPSTLDNTIPGGPSGVDIDGDGYVDRVYVGDLEGRLWKLDTTNGGVAASTWPMCVLFDAGLPSGTGDRGWAPIVTKPAIALINKTRPNIYFGTGGDDRAPDNLLYRFYSVMDRDANGTCRGTPIRESDLLLSNNEWIVGDNKTNEPVPRGYTAGEITASKPEGETGDRFWSDPVIANNSSIYFASLPGKIESVNPCTNLTGQSKLYGYAIRSYRSLDGVMHSPGTSIFVNALNASIPWMQASGKIRRAVMVRGATTEETVTRPILLGESVPKTDVLIQEFSGDGGTTDRPAVRRISEVGALIRNHVRVLRWREVPL